MRLYNSSDYKTYAFRRFSLVFVLNFKVNVPETPLSFVFIYDTVIYRNILEQLKAQEMVWLCLHHMLTYSSKHNINIMLILVIGTFYEVVEKKNKTDGFKSDIHGRKHEDATPLSLGPNCLHFIF